MDWVMFITHWAGLSLPVPTATGYGNERRYSQSSYSWKFGRKWLRAQPQRSFVIIGVCSSPLFWCVDGCLSRPLQLNVVFWLIADIMSRSIQWMLTSQRFTCLIGSCASNKVASASCQSLSQEPSPALLPWQWLRKGDVSEVFFYG